MSSTVYTATEYGTYFLRSLCFIVFCVKVKYICTVHLLFHYHADDDRQSKQYVDELSLYMSKYIEFTSLFLLFQVTSECPFVGVDVLTAECTRSH